MGDRYPKAVCDYTCANEYQDHEKNVLLWAWEFIRRNAKYQKLSDAVDTARSNPQAYKLAFDELVINFGPWIYPWRSGTDAVKQNGSVQNHYNLPPTINAAPSGSYSDLYEYPGLDETSFELPVTMTFDASRSLDQQIKEASRILSFIKAKSVKGQLNRLSSADVPAKTTVPIPSNSIDLLRILDALATTPMPIDADIKRALAWSVDGTSTRMQQAQRKAISLRDGDALLMPMSGKYRSV